MQNPSYLEYLLFVILSILSGLGVRFALGYAKQTWAMTYHHTMSYALLPGVTMIITTLISGNIALSLGMIGALSIVRFRNPVKNPFELVIFFALITMGIGFSVNAKLGLLMTVVVMSLIIITKKIEDFKKKRGKNLFSLSFEESSTIHVMEIKSLLPIKILDESKHLAQLFSSKNPTSYNYRLIFSDKSEMENIKKIIDENKGIESIEIRYAL
mgnify:FL=1